MKQSTTLINVLHVSLAPGNTCLKNGASGNAKSIKDAIIAWKTFLKQSTTLINVLHVSLVPGNTCLKNGASFQVVHALYHHKKNNDALCLMM